MDPSFPVCRASDSTAALSAVTGEASWLTRVGDFFSSNMFMPHGMCFLWRPELVWLHVISDLVIGISYSSIPLALYLFANKRKDLEFKSVFLMFTAFILLCGATHFFAIVVLWSPHYGAQGLLKLATALVSAVTAFVLWRLMPQALAVPGPGHYQAQNEKLAAEITSRTEAERKLRDLNRDLEAIVEDRTRQLNQSNSELTVITTRLQTIMDDSIDGFITIDAEGRIHTYNKAAEAIFGHPTSDVLGEAIALIIPHGAALPIAEASEGGGLRREGVGLRADGARIPLDLSISPIEIDGALSYSLIVRDITARKKAEQALKESEERYYVAMEGSSVGLWDWDLRRNTHYWSPRCREIIGLYGDATPFDIAAFRRRIHRDDRARVSARMIAHLRRGEPIDVEFRMKRGRAAYVWVHVSGQAIWDESGRAVRMAGSIVDITDRKKAEQLKSEFVATVSHELRTPMTSIMGAMGLIRSGRLGPLNIRAQNMLDIADANGRRLVQLINDLLDIEKIEAGQLDFNMTTCSLHELLAAAAGEAKGMALEHNIAVALEPPEVDVPLRVDADRFAQVMANLLSNAIKFTEASGQVTVRGEDRGDVVRVSVEDQGPGVPLEFQAKIFEKFTQADQSDTRRVGGTGLGLSITKAIVETFGGAISFTTREGEGSVFFFDLPKADTKDDARAAAG